ncbi:MAG: acetate--CoA ligase [Planctomycetes bacterium]|nr:acetate--CoA ligase [Planctomycetota bacterium]
MTEEEKTISSMMDEKRVFSPSKEFSEKAWIKSEEEFNSISNAASEDFEAFWADKADQLHWFKKWDKIYQFDAEKIDIKWFDGGKMNASYNCLDRWIGTEKENKTAFIWVGNDPEETKKITYKELHTEVSKFANVLKSQNVQKGDKVIIYMPMILELPIAMLACARIGAVHSIIFGGFSPDSIKDRVIDSGSKMIITANWGYRGKKNDIPLKHNIDAGIEGTDANKVIVFERVPQAEKACNWVEGRDLWWHDLMKDASADCPAEENDSEHPLFILYTSGTTGKPKGVLHTTGGYMTYVHQTAKWIFDLHDDDVYWCTADIGWVTGHSYIVYGPLSLGVTGVMFEGVPTYPDAGRFWSEVEKHKVSVFYTAPTALRALMAQGDDHVKKYDLSSLRILGTVGEPINPEAWMWYYNLIGGGKCPIVDTWWQTETGGILISPVPGAQTLKPGSATKAFPGVFPNVLKQNGTQAEVNEGGYLVMEKPWPGIMRTVYGDHQRFIDTYWAKFKGGKYWTGDGARIDEDGCFWLMGRLDDVLNVSGHRIGTAEVESALVAHHTVAESAVVGMPHPIKGEGIYAFVTLKVGVEQTDELMKELVKHVRTMIGPIATPDVIQFADQLPKTRSGKIMRRILRKIAKNDLDVGDTTTLADSSVVQKLIDERPNK